MLEFTPSAATRELGEKLTKTRQQIVELFDAHRKDDGYDMPAEKVAEVRKLNDEAERLAKEYEAALDLERTAARNREALQGLTQVRAPEPAGKQARVPSLRDALAAKADEWRALADGHRGTVRVEIHGPEAKTLLTSADIAPQADRLARIIPSAQYLRDVTDLFAQGTTESDAVEFYEETLFTNGAAETAEGSAAPESAIDFTLRSWPVQEISTFIPVTRRTLADVALIQSYVEGRLRYMLAARRSAQLLNGNGVSPNLRGVLQVGGIGTQAKGSDPVFDAILKAMTKVRVDGAAEPSGIVLHPNDWQNIRLTRTIDGIYILGAPTEAGPARLWGLDVAESTSIAAGTALVGAFSSMAQVFRRESATIEASTEHSDYFTRRQVALLIYERLALAVYRPAAFCQVTGI